MLTRPAVAALCLVSISAVLGLSGCRGTGYRFGHSRTACRQEQYAPYGGQTPSYTREYDPMPSQSVPGRVGPSLSPPSDSPPDTRTNRPRRIAPTPTERPMPVPPSPQPRGGASGTTLQRLPMRDGALPARDAGPYFGQQDPIAEPIESQRKWFPRPTNMPRVLESMRHRLRQVFRRDASRRADGPKLDRSRYPGRADSYGFRTNSPDGKQIIRADNGRSRYASTRPVAYRRALPMSDLNGKRIQPHNGRAASGPLVKLDNPRMPRYLADRTGGIVRTTGDDTQRITPRQAGPSTSRRPLMSVPRDDEPLEMWPHSPSTALIRD